MKTLPDLTAAQHIDRLRDWLERCVPEIRQYELLFVDWLLVTRVGNDWVLAERQLMRQPEFEPFFEKLCDQGYSWINLSGNAPWKHYYLVSVEHGRSTISPLTSINLSGPSLGFDHKPLIQTKLIIQRD